MGLERVKGVECAGGFDNRIDLVGIVGECVGEFGMAGIKSANSDKKIMFDAEGIGNNRK